MAVTSRPARGSVLIVGAGPTGLVLAIELGRAGVPCVLVDDRREVDDRPKAQLANIRTMEHFRRLGLADELRDRALLPADFPYNVVFVDRLLGREITRFDSRGIDSMRSVPFFSEPPQRVPQYVIERLLREVVATLPSVECRYGWRLTDYAQDDHGVAARLTDCVNGGTGHVEAEWLVGCDGVRSRVRDVAGIPLSGSPAGEMSVGIFFDAPTLWDLHDKGRAIMYWILDARWPGLLGPVDTGSRWWFQLVGLPRETDVGGLDLSSILHAVVGRQFPHEITRVQPWEAPSLLAERYRDRRVFLAGDAAHQHPPTGGYGMNSGIGDAVDLGWKLGAVSTGWGDPALLDSYELERRPVAKRIVDEAGRNSSAISSAMSATRRKGEPPDAGHIRKTTGQEFRSIGLQLGYRYDQSPIIVPDGSDAPPLEVSKYVPSARPGGRLPHAWLADGSSLFDHLSRGYTLLSVGRSEHPCGALLHAARTAGVPLEVVRIVAPELRQLLEADLVLVRPDQHVAWRANGVPSDCAALFARLRGSELRGREAAV